jgi:hypothetical protein
MTVDSIFRRSNVCNVGAMQSRVSKLEATVLSYPRSERCCRALLEIFGKIEQLIAATPELELSGIIRTRGPINTS